MNGRANIANVALVPRGKVLRLTVGSFFGRVTSDIDWSPALTGYRQERSSSPLDLFYLHAAHKGQVIRSPPRSSLAACAHL